MKEDLFLRGGVWEEPFLSVPKVSPQILTWAPLILIQLGQREMGRKENKGRGGGSKTSSHEDDIHTTQNSTTNSSTSSHEEDIHTTHNSTTNSFCMKILMFQINPKH